MVSPRKVTRLNFVVLFYWGGLSEPPITLSMRHAGEAPAVRRQWWAAALSEVTIAVQVDLFRLGRRLDAAVKKREIDELWGHD
jgi:hypothetical protein